MTHVYENSDSESDSHELMVFNQPNEDIYNECRICYDIVDNPVDYCNCRGTQGVIHEECLIKSIPTITMLNNKYYLKCDLCKYDIEINYSYSKSYYIVWFVSFLIFLVTYLYFMLINNIRYYASYIDTQPEISKQILGIGMFVLIICIFFTIYFIMYWFLIKMILKLCRLDTPKIKIM